VAVAVQAGQGSEKFISNFHELPQVVVHIHLERLVFDNLAIVEASLFQNSPACVPRVAEFFVAGIGEAVGTCFDLT
jgi:hypothetical protein